MVNNRPGRIWQGSPGNERPTERKLDKLSTHIILTRKLYHVQGRSWDIPVKSNIQASDLKTSWTPNVSPTLYTDWLAEGESLKSWEYLSTISVQISSWQLDYADTAATHRKVSLLSPEKTAMTYAKYWERGKNSVNQKFYIQRNYSPKIKVKF